MERWEREAAARLPELIRAWFALDDDDTVVVHPGVSAADSGVDLVAQAPDHTFFVQVKGTDNIASLERAAAHRRDRHGIHLLVVPFMGPKAREWARQHKIAWADLSGNAEVHTHGLHIHVDGHRNAYAAVGRPANAFSPRFSRVSRVLLASADTWWKQKDLAAETSLPDGTISKVVQRLTSLDLLERNEAGAIRARAPSLLLDAWAQRYSFDEHVVRRYHAVGRSGNAILKALAEKLSDTSTVWAATGLSAAYMYTRFADFRLTSIFVDRFPEDPQSLGLRAVDRGENVWLIGPRDDGVFYKKVEQGVWCVHPVQVYLDLASHPERSAEAAGRLREEWMSWRA